MTLDGAGDSPMAKSFSEGVSYERRFNKRINGLDKGMGMTFAWHS